MLKTFKLFSYSVFIVYWGSTVQGICAVDALFICFAAPFGQGQGAVSVSCSSVIFYRRRPRKSAQLPRWRFDLSDLKE